MQNYWLMVIVDSTIFPQHKQQLGLLAQLIQTHMMDLLQ